MQASTITNIMLMFFPRGWTLWYKVANNRGLNNLHVWVGGPCGFEIYDAIAILGRRDHVIGTPWDPTVDPCFAK